MFVCWEQYTFEADPRTAIAPNKWLPKATTPPQYIRAPTAVVDISRLLDPKGSTSPSSTSKPNSATSHTDSRPDVPRVFTTHVSQPSPYSPSLQHQSLLQQPASFAPTPGYAPAGNPTLAPPNPDRGDANTSLPFSQAQNVEAIESSRSLKRQASSEPHPQERGAKKQSKWSAEENERIIQLRGSGMKWEDVSRHLPGRSAISCRLHYQNFLERRPEWDEEKKNKLARLYERFRREMWEKVAKDLPMPWRAAEEMHWQLGKSELAQRAGVHPFSGALEPSASTITAPGPGVPITTSFGPAPTSYSPHSYTSAPQFPDTRPPRSITMTPTSLPPPAFTLTSSQSVPEGHSDYPTQPPPRGTGQPVARRTASGTSSPVRSGRPRKPSGVGSPRNRAVSEHRPMHTPGRPPFYPATSVPSQSLPPFSQGNYAPRSPHPSDRPSLPPVRFIAGEGDRPVRDGGSVYEPASHAWPSTSRPPLPTSTNGTSGSYHGR